MNLRVEDQLGNREPSAEFSKNRYTAALAERIGWRRVRNEKEWRRRLREAKGCCVIEK